MNVSGSNYNLLKRYYNIVTVGSLRNNEVHVYNALVNHVLSLQVKSGTIFDNFLICDDVKEAEDFGNETWGATKVQDQYLV